ncbi:alpha-1,4-N-acetylglucosaminyltransferase-like [Amblyraja radiata]|uniref:alpha-1,4-N-acetylglucosaminyltransferase-like n=1 Tax=Amblyraja radiata TaxID=386614 RepID=UPI00140415A5|nr:alpha-1,4-N-acetylglucosaminyltransferase-like [Amblyraja radiata]
MNPIHHIFIVVFIIGASVLLYVSWHLQTQQNVPKHMVGMSHVEDEAPMDDPRPLLNPGIMFVETTDKVELKPLVMCSVESTARQNPDKTIYFFMKGFSDNLSQYPEPKYRLVPLLSSMKNVVLLPLNANELFDDTALKIWYRKVTNKKKVGTPKADPWQRDRPLQDVRVRKLHCFVAPELPNKRPPTPRCSAAVQMFFLTDNLTVFTDGCRLALLWKYGGIYLDTYIISMRPMPFTNLTYLGSTRP